MEIIIKKAHSHYNRELGMQIRNEAHYKDVLKRRGLCTKEEGDDLAHRATEKQRKEYRVDEDTRKFLSEIKNTASKDGKVQLGGRAIEFMKKKGVKFEKSEYLGQQGGWK